MCRLKQCLLLLVLFYFFINNTGYAQISSSEIDEIIENAMETFNVTGVAVGIVKDGEIIFTKGYGVKSIETNAAVNEHTGFAIASNTKAFTTTALAILEEEGKLSWHDKVVDIIPEFKMYDPYVTANFNIQDLLTHRSGLGLGAGDLMIFPDSTDFTIKDILNNFQYFKPKSAFRTKYDYDNLLYMVAGEVIARVSGMSWEEFIKTRIMEPLNMDNSYSTLYDVKDKSNLATPHSTETGTIRTVEYDTFDTEKVNGAAASIISNVDDLCNWMLVHLNHGKYGENLELQLFSEKNQREMWKIHTTLNADRNPRYNSHFRGYGLGWVLSDIKGNMSVSHTGALAGMLSKTIMIPDLNFGVVILTNTWLGGAYLFSAVSQTIVDRYLGLEDYNWIEDYYNSQQKRQSSADSVVTEVWETVKATSNEAINVEDFIGVYKDNWFGNVEVFMNNNQLWIKCYRSPKLNGPMYYYKANTFAIKWLYQELNGDAFAIFSFYEEGKAQNIRMKGISPNIDFSFDFQDLDLRRIENK